MGGKINRIKNDNDYGFINWLKSRIEERTSWDGAALILIGVIVLIAGPFAKLAAYAAIAYGAWTIYKKED